MLVGVGVEPLLGGSDGAAAVDAIHCLLVQDFL